MSVGQVPNFFCALWKALLLIFVREAFSVSQHLTEKMKGKVQLPPVPLPPPSPSLLPPPSLPLPYPLTALAPHSLLPPPGLTREARLTREKTSFPPL